MTNLLDVIWYPVALVLAAPVVIWHAIFDKDSDGRP